MVQQHKIDNTIAMLDAKIEYVYVDYSKYSGFILFTGFIGKL